MRIFYLVSILFFLGPCVLRGQVYHVYDNFEEFEERMLKVSQKTTLVINFWATWCPPCIEELPCFEELHQKYASPDFQVWLVSLDFKSRLEKVVNPFVKEKQLKSEVIILDEQDADSWIPKIHPDWQGTIPATLLIRGEQRAFYAEQFESFEELETFVLKFLKTVQKVVGMSNGGTR